MSMVGGLAVMVLADKVLAVAVPEIADELAAPVRPREGKMTFDIGEVKPEVPLSRREGD